MAAGLEATLSIFSLLHPSSSSSKSLQLPLCKLHFPISTSTLSFKSSALLHPLSTIQHGKLAFEIFSAVQEEVAVEAVEEEKPETEIKRKLYLANLPWTLSVTEIKKLFSVCGKVRDVEIIKEKEGKKSRGFAFVTMGSGEEAQAAVEKFDAHEISGRVIRVQFAKRFRKPAPPRPAGLPTKETRHKLYVSNLAWKTRSHHLREFFSSSFKPVSARVVFNSASGNSAGYGFVSFASSEEAEAAISALDGQELLGRPIRLKLSEKNIDEPGTEKEKEDVVDEQSQES